jgi:hypothetical protein
VTWHLLGQLAGAALMLALFVFFVACVVAGAGYVNAVIDDEKHVFGVMHKLMVSLGAMVGVVLVCWIGSSAYQGSYHDLTHKCVHSEKEWVLQSDGEENLVTVCKREFSTGEHPSRLRAFVGIFWWE